MGLRNETQSEFEAGCFCHDRHRHEGLIYNGSGVQPCTCKRSIRDMSYSIQFYQLLQTRSKSRGCQIVREHI